MVLREEGIPADQKTVQKKGKNVNPKVSRKPNKEERTGEKKLVDGTVGWTKQAPQIKKERSQRLNRRLIREEDSSKSRPRVELLGMDTTC